MYDIVTIGGGTFDLFVKAHDAKVSKTYAQSTSEEYLLLPYGGKEKIDEVHETLGGGAHNTSVAFARLGLKSAYCGLIGEDMWGKKILANMEREKVCKELLSITEDEKTSFSVILNSFEGERTVLNYTGANHLFTEEYFPLAKVMQTKWIFLNHLSGEANRLVKKVEKALISKPELKLAWNPGGVQLSAGAEEFKDILEKTEVLFLNKEEAEKFSGLKVAGNIKNMEKVADLRAIFKFFSNLGVKTTVITDGRRGAQAYDGKDIYYAPVLNSERVDTLGAGDSFASGLTAGLIMKNDLQTALKIGTINATSVVGYYGAQTGLLQKKNMEEKLKNTRIQIKKINS